MDKVEIQQLTEKHFTDCLDLWRNENMAHEPDMLLRLEKLISKQTNLSKVALDDDNVVGCVLCSFNEFTAYVFRLVVAPEYRMKGVGGLIMDACEASAHQSGAAKVSLDTEGSVAEWFEHRGYTKTTANFLFKLLE